MSMQIFCYNSNSLWVKNDPFRVSRYFYFSGLLVLKLAKLFKFYEKRSKIEFNKGERILSANALKVFFVFL